uniref:UPF0725 protein n=1 Tax=Noccaea caerulescens TaxID=107243 RepID=A0A1J3IDW8_NOCCA
MYDVMLDEAKLWLDEPLQRKRKLEAPPAPVEDYSSAPISDSDEDNEVDLVEKEKYRQQVVESGGFDVDPLLLRYGKLQSYGSAPDTILLSKVGLHCYNFDKGTNLQFRTVKKANTEFISFLVYYITLEAMDPLNNALVSFQTSVWDAATKNKESLRLITELSRITGTGEETSLWDSDGVDEFYKDDMSQWLEDDALTGSDKLQYYEVKESDLRDNEWLYLYAEVALFSKWAIDLSAYLPVEMKRVVVRTREDVEPHMKLKSHNATFYMSFKTRGGLECRGIIRRTSDGRPQHMSLQVKCWIDK